MAAPGVLTPSSPIFTVHTPAVLQGEPPAWAMPTPSPSPLIRCPQEPPLECGGRGNSQEREAAAAVMSKEVLWEVCAPFIGQMLEELLKCVQQSQLEQQQADLQRQQANSTRERVTTSPLLDDKDPDAFASLFDPPPSVAKRGEPLRRLAEDDERLEEQEVVSAGSSSCPTPTREPASSTGQRKPQKVVRSSSKGSSPILEAQEPSFSSIFGMASHSAGGGGSDGAGSSDVSLPQKVHSPTMPEISDDAMPTDVEITPIYLTWNQQHAGKGAQRWADQRLSPTVSPVAPMACPPGESGQTQLYLAVQGDGSFDEEVSPAGDAAASNAEKSVMVCRHWKSKGFCRLEDKCKFLHPEHKRGPSNMPAAKADGGSANASGAGTQATAAGATGASSSGKRSRRSGRNRNSVSNASGAGSAPAQPVAVGPLHNTGGAQAPILGGATGPS